MLVPCPNCPSHFDDSYQSDECNGLVPGPPGHRPLRSKPITEHKQMTRAAHDRAALKKKRARA